MFSRSESTDLPWNDGQDCMNHKYAQRSSKNCFVYNSGIGDGVELILLSICKIAERD